MKHSRICSLIAAWFSLTGQTMCLAADQIEASAKPSRAATASPAAAARKEARGKKLESQVERQQAQMMHGYVSTTKSQDEIAACIDEALATAIHNSIEAQQHDSAVQKNSRPWRRTWRGTKAAVNFMLCDRGFAPSTEGGKLQLDEQVKVRDKVSAECAKQLWLDKTHDQVVENIVEMVTGLGSGDQARKQQLVNDAVQSLNSLSSEECARHILQRLTLWSDKACVQDAMQVFDNRQPLSIKERQGKVQLILNAVSKDDPIVGDVVQRVHKYTKHSRASIVTSQVVETSLSIASVTPNFVAPAASALLLVFFMSTGGPEEDKLLSEMYLGKRLQSRKNSLTMQAGMAVDAYQLAMVTHNVPLLKCSESLVTRLVGNEICSSVCRDPGLAPSEVPPGAVNAAAQLPAALR